MPEVLNAEVLGHEPDIEERVNIAWRMNMILLEALLGLAREVDDLRASFQQPPGL